MPGEPDIVDYSYPREWMTIWRKLAHNQIYSAGPQALIGAGLMQIERVDGEIAYLNGEEVYWLAPGWFEWAKAQDAEARLWECTCLPSTIRMPYPVCKAFYEHQRRGDRSDQSILRYHSYGRMLTEPSTSLSIITDA